MLANSWYLVSIVGRLTELLIALADLLDSSVRQGNSQKVVDSIIYDVWRYIYTPIIVI